VSANVPRREDFVVLRVALPADTRRVVLLERRPLSEIEAFFADIGLRTEVHTEQPPAPTPDEIRRMPSRARRVLRSQQQHPPKHWVDIFRLDGAVVHRWYGLGTSADDAIRRAAERWRVEQGT
jgi:uncharacterized protein (UPF0128 family)